MMNLFDLSKYVLVPILTEWLNPEDIGALDSAICNKASRSTYFALIKSYPVKFEECIFPADRSCFRSFIAGEWAQKRHLKGPVNVTMTHGYLSLLSKDLAKRNKLLKGRQASDSIFEVVSNIKSFTMEGCGNKTVENLKFLFCDMKNLTYLKVVELPLHDLLDVLIDSCHQLKSLSIGSSEIPSFSSCGDYYFDDKIKIFLRQQSNLEELTVSAPCFAIVAYTLIVHCRKLKIVHLEYDQHLFEMKESILIHFLMHCSPLSLFDFYLSKPEVSKVLFARHSKSLTSLYLREGHSLMFPVNIVNLNIENYSVVEENIFLSMNNTYSNLKELHMKGSVPTSVEFWTNALSPCLEVLSLSGNFSCMQHENTLPIIVPILKLKDIKLKKFTYNESSYNGGYFKVEYAEYFRHLIEIELHTKADITVLLAIAHHCTELEAFTYSNNCLRNTAGLEWLLEIVRRGKIRKLGVCLPHKDIVKVLQFTPKLLDLAWYQEITVGALLEVLAMLPCLTHLRHGPITTAMIKKIEKVSPFLKICAARYNEV